MPTDDYAGLVRSALQQKYAMIERDPRDEKWAEWHAHPDTLMMIKRHGVQGSGPGDPPSLLDSYPPALPGQELRIFGYPVRVDHSVPVDQVKLVCETDLDATIRHQVAAGCHVNIAKAVPFLPPAPPTPTLKALVKHWRESAPVRRILRKANRR